MVGGSIPLAVIKYLSLLTTLGITTMTYILVRKSVVVFDCCVIDAPQEIDPVGFMIMKTSKERLS